MVDDAAGLAFIVNLGCIELHPHPVRTGDLDHPDELRIDLDPTPGRRMAGHPPRRAGGEGAPRRARPRPAGRRPAARAACTSTSASSRAGPSPRSGARRSRSRARSSGGCPASRPRSGGRRSGRASSSTTTRTPRTARRARPTRCGRCPTRACRRRCRWDEVPDCEPADFTVLTMPARFAAIGDPHAGMDAAAGSLEPLLELAARDEAAGLGDAPWPPHFQKHGRRGTARRAVAGEAARRASRRRRGRRSRSSPSPTRPTARRRSPGSSAGRRAIRPSRRTSRRPTCWSMRCGAARRPGPGSAINLEHVPEAERPPAGDAGPRRRPDARVARGGAEAANRRRGQARAVVGAVAGPRGRGPASRSARVPRSVISRGSARREAATSAIVAEDRPQFAVDGALERRIVPPSSRRRAAAAGRRSRSSVAMASAHLVQAPTSTSNASFAGAAAEDGEVGEEIERTALEDDVCLGLRCVERRDAVLELLEIVGDRRRVGEDRAGIGERLERLGDMRVPGWPATKILDERRLAAAVGARDRDLISVPHVGASSPCRPAMPKIAASSSRRDHLELGEGAIARAPCPGASGGTGRCGGSGRPACGRRRPRRRARGGAAPTTAPCPGSTGSPRPAGASRSASASAVAHSFQGWSPRSVRPVGCEDRDQFLPLRGGEAAADADVLERRRHRRRGRGGASRRRLCSEPLCQRNPATTQSHSRSCFTFSMARLPGS